MQEGLGTTCLFWLLVRSIPVLITNNDIFRAVLPIENVCVQSFGHIEWALKNVVHGQTLSNLQVHYIWSLPPFLTRVSSINYANTDLFIGQKIIRDGRGSNFFLFFIDVHKSKHLPHQHSKRPNIASFTVNTILDDFYWTPENIYQLKQVIQ